MKKLILVAVIFSLMVSVTSCKFVYDVGETSGDITGEQQDNGEAGFADESQDSDADRADTDTNDAVNDSDAENVGTDTAEANTKMIAVILYFPTADNSALKKEAREIPVKDGAVLKACMQALAEGPETEGLRNPIPEGTSVRGITIKNNTAIVDLSREFLNNSGLDEVTSRLSIVNTLTQFDGVDKVRLWIEGEELSGPGGMPLGDMSPASLDDEGNPVSLDTEGNSPSGEMTVTLYFSDSQAMYVVGEKRDIKVPDGAGPEELVLKELIAGPRSEELWNAIPDGTRLLSVSTKNGLCTVNFSKEFVENSPGGTASEKMAIYSVVNTLTELEGIEKVQFLIEGEKREIYTHAVFNEPFSRNESVIAK